MFDNTYSQLPERFFARQPPARVPKPDLIRLNEALAGRLGLDAGWLSGIDGIAMLAGNHVPASAAPLAMAYAGHQFGGWAPQLGDGRAILLGEIVCMDGERFDLQLKGAGRTPFSRMGDGRAVLGPVLREYLISEAMAALGIPTTRSLAAVTTGDMVMRDELLSGAVLTRIAKSHVRVGTFEYFAARRDEPALRILADYVIKRHRPTIAEEALPYPALYREVIVNQANLIAQWMAVGFIHGVMNTDNMSIAGETIDYGPCAFMDRYAPNAVYSSIDQAGRYAFANQPYIGQWNLMCLARAMLPILAETPEKAAAVAQEALDEFPGLFQSAWLDAMRRKLGLARSEGDDEALINDLLDRMHAGNADYTLTFRNLSKCSSLPDEHDQTVRLLFAEPSAFDDWAVTWRNRLVREDLNDEVRRASMQQVNPAFIARNHRVEEAISAATAGDLTVFERLLTVVGSPFEAHSNLAYLMQPPKPHEVIAATYCGT